MSTFEQFLATYVDTNVPPGSPAFDREFLIEQLLQDFRATCTKDLYYMSLNILVALCCANKRADLVSRIISASRISSSAAEPISMETFGAIRETTTVIWPFVGVPQVVPACLGLTGYKQFHDLAPDPYVRTRPDLGPKYTSIGAETREEIYKASANPEVFEMLRKNFGDLAHAFETVGFGYNLGHTPRVYFSLGQAELLVTAALLGLGASRQARSHIKACVGFGYSVEELQSIVQMANNLAKWANPSAPSMNDGIDVNEMSEQARVNMKKTVAKNLQ